MELTKQFFDTHPLQNVYKSKLKKIHKFSILIRAIILILSVIALFTPFDGGGSSVIDLFDYFIYSFDHRITIVPTFTMLLPIIFVFAELLVILIMLANIKLDDFQSIGNCGKISLFIQSAIDLILPIVGVSIYSSYVKRLYAINLTFLVVITVLLAIINSTMFFYYRFTARKFIIDVVNSIEGQEKVNEINKTVRKAVTKANKGSNSIRKYAPMLSLHRGLFPFIMCIVYAIMLCIYPLFTFSMTAKFPTELDVDYKDVSIYLPADVISNGMQSGSINHVIYSEGYNYYLERIEHLESKEKEIKNKYGSYSSSNMSEEDKTELNNLETQIKQIEKTLSTIEYQTITVSLYRYTVSQSYNSTVVSFKVSEFTLNANPRNNIKTVKSVTLSKNDFTTDTNFSNEKISALVEYTDGSKKLSYISPSNASELNSASKGKYDLKWSDSWGEYSKTINIS